MAKIRYVRARVGTRQIVEPPLPESRPLSLFDFVEANHALIGVLGVFTALTVFAVQLPVYEIGIFVGFLLMGITLLTWIELWTRVPSGPKSWRLETFRTLVQLALLALFLYWFVDFRAVWAGAMPLVLFTLILGVYGVLIVHWKPLDRFRIHSGEKFERRHAIGIALALTAVVFAWVMAAYLSPPLDAACESLYGIYSWSSPAQP